jgi:hypothetical protein
VYVRVRRRQFYSSPSFFTRLKLLRKNLPLVQLSGTWRHPA